MTRRVHWAWVVLFTSFVTVFIHYSIRLGYGILMPEMILSLKITKGQAGSIASSFYLAYGLFAPLLGFLVDRCNVRLLLFLFACIMGSGTLLMARPENLNQACLAFFIVGVGASAMWTPVVALVQRWFADHRRGMALGILSVSYAIGYGAMGLALPPVVGRFGWQSCWVILGILAFLLAPLNALFLRNRPQDVNERPWGEGAGPLPPASSASKPDIPYRKMIKSPVLWLAAGSYFCVAFSSYVINIFMVTYGTLELKFPFAKAAQLASYIAFSGIGGAFLIPFLSDFIGRKRTLLIIMSGIGLSTVLIIWSGGDWTRLIVAVSLFGFFYASAWPTYGAVAADLFPPEATGTVLGFWTIFYGLSLSLAAALGGYLADVTGTFFYTFAAGVIGSILAVFFILPVKEIKGGTAGVVFEKLPR